MKSIHINVIFFILFALKVSSNAITISTLDEQFSQNKILGSIIEHSPHENSTKQAYDNFFENTFDWNLDFEINNTRVLNSGENLTSGLLSYNFRKVDFNFNSGSSLILNVPGEFYAGALKFQKDSKLIPQTNGSVIFYVGNDFQWNGTIVADDMVSAAHHFMIYYYGTNPVYIQTEFAGTIIAPNAEVIVGQVGKNFYGAIYAKSIEVHQDTKVIWVPFLRESVNSVLSTKKSLDSSTIEGFFVYESLKLKLNFARLCIPNFFSVFFNGSVRAELAHASHVENSFFSPSLCIEIFLSDFFMTFYIATEIG